MRLPEIPEVRLEDSGGVTFSYLVFQLELGGEKKSVVRGLNYQPSERAVEERIIGWAKDELEECGFFESGGDFLVEGGGSLTINPYDETVVLFGSNKAYGSERDREEVARRFERSFPNHEVTCFVPEAVT